MSEAKKRIYPFQCLATDSIAKQFAFKEFMRGLSNAFSKSNMNVSTCPLLSKILAQSFITVVNWVSQLCPFLNACCLSDIVSLYYQAGHCSITICHVGTLQHYRCAIILCVCVCVCVCVRACVCVLESLSVRYRPPAGKMGIQQSQLTPSPVQVLSIAGQLYVSPHGAPLSSTPSCFLITRIFPGFSSLWRVTDLVDGEELGDFQ